jgi:hypothetical protein
VRGRRLVWALALLWVAWSGRGTAADIPSDKKALILLRVLAYDRNLAGRSGAAVHVAVLYKTGDPVSERSASDLIAAAGVSERSVAGKPVRLVSLAFSPDSVERDLQRIEAAAAFVAPGLEPAVPRIAATTQRLGILSFSSEEEMVKSALSIGLVRRGERAAILVNLVAARAENADLSADLLRLAEVVRR